MKHEEIEWFNIPAAVPSESAHRAAEARQAILTKPPGALGRVAAGVQCTCHLVLRHCRLQRQIGGA